MKTYYSSEDIESFADRGQSEISIDENVVLTDLAKQTAHMLGIRIVNKPSVASPGAFIPVQPQSTGRPNAFSGKPRGCQRRPAEKSGQSFSPPVEQSRQVMDKLVEKIKHINSKSL